MNKSNFFETLGVPRYQAGDMFDLRCRVESAIQGVRAHRGNVAWSALADDPFDSPKWDGFSEDAVIFRSEDPITLEMIRAEMVRQAKPSDVKAVDAGEVDQHGNPVAWAED